MRVFFCLFGWLSGAAACLAQARRAHHTDRANALQLNKDWLVFGSPAIGALSRLPPKAPSARLGDRQKVHFCDSDHSQLAVSALSPWTEVWRAAMRQILSIAVVATLVIATLVDVVVAGVKTSTMKRHFYYAAPASGVGMAVPSSTKNFPVELPQ